MVFAVRIQRGRGKYGHHGRTCGGMLRCPETCFFLEGYGQKKGGGAGKRGRRTLNPGYEGNQKPLHLKTPKLTQDVLLARLQLFKRASEPLFASNATP